MKLGSAAKTDQVRGWLAEQGYDGALFRTRPEVASVTDRLTDPVVRNEEPGLVWALVTAPWYRPGGLAQAVKERAGGLRLATDPDELAVLRMPLTPVESERLSVLGRDTASALELALLSWHPSERECDVATRIALLTGSLTALAPPKSPSRTVAAGPADPELAARHLAACTVEAGFHDEWRSHMQVGLESEPKGRGAAWTEERRSEARKRRGKAASRGAPEPSERGPSGADGPVPVTNTASWPADAGGRPAIVSV